MHLTLSWRGPLSYRNQSIDLQSKSMDWFLYANGLRHERVKKMLRWIRLIWFNATFFSGYFRCIAQKNQIGIRFNFTRVFSAALLHCIYCVKSAQIRSFFWSVYSCIRTEYRKKLDQKKLRISTLLTQWLSCTWKNCIVAPSLKYTSDPLKTGTHQMFWNENTKICSHYT